MTIAAATRRRMMMQMRMKIHRGRPQQRRRRGPNSPVDGESREETILFLARPELVKKRGGRSPVGVTQEGEGKDARISDIEPDRRRVVAKKNVSTQLRLMAGWDNSRDGNFSLPSPLSSESTMPSLLAVLPRSNTEARRVALLIKSGRLVILILDSWTPPA